SPLDYRETSDESFVSYQMVLSDYEVEPLPSSGPKSEVVAQLDADYQAMQTEFQSLAAKSGLTIADINNLDADDRVMSTSYQYTYSGVNYWMLPTAFEEVVAAVASGTSTTQAEADFKACFAEPFPHAWGATSLPQPSIDKTFNDVVHAIR